MELHAPGLGLIAWTLISLVILVFEAVALVLLFRSDCNSQQPKFFWAVNIIGFPFLGSILFLLFHKQSASGIFNRSRSTTHGVLPP